MSDAGSRAETTRVPAQRPIQSLDGLAGILLLIAVFACSFTALPFWSGTLAKVQLTEMAFVLLLPVAVVAWRREIRPPRAWLLVSGLYVAANVGAALASGARASLLESLGRGYLVLLSCLVAAYVRRHGISGIRLVALAWLSGGLLQAGITLVGYALAVIGVANATVKVFPNYPYFGTVFRAAGLTDTPGMLIIVLGFPLLWTWASAPEQRGRSLSLAVLGLATLLTLSKELVLMGLGLALLHPALAYKHHRLRAGVVVLAATVLWTGSHVIFVRPTPGQPGYLADTPYTSGRVLARLGGVDVIETTYTTLKRANWIIGRAHPALGVGPGQSNSHLALLKTAGLYPATLPDYDPHSTWVGAFSETGLLGLCALILLVWCWARTIGRARLLSSQDPALRAAAVFLLLLLIESVMIDAMNFRQIWIAGGLVLGASGVRLTPVTKTG